MFMILKMAPSFYSYKCTYDVCVYIRLARTYQKKDSHTVSVLRLRWKAESFFFFLTDGKLRVTE